MIGENVKKLREESGLSQKDLSRLLGVSRSAVTLIEANRRKVSADEIVRLCEIFGVSADELLNHPIRDQSAEVFERAFNQLNEEDQREVIEMIHFKIAIYRKKK